MMYTALDDPPARLEALGDETVCAQNRRHGGSDNQFGVALGTILEAREGSAYQP